MGDTKLTFAHALIELLHETSFDKITVTQITQKAHKTRQTFYRNFEDKEDLVHWYFEKLCLQSFKEMGVSTTLKEALTSKFTFIQSQKEFFKEAFKSDDYNSLTAYDYRCIYNFYKELIEKKTNIDQELDFLLQMYCHGSIEMTKKWVASDMQLDIPVLVDLLIEALPEQLRPYIDIE